MTTFRPFGSTKDGSPSPLWTSRALTMLHTWSAARMVFALLPSTLTCVGFEYLAFFVCAYI